jgi:hypothetical protein
MEGNAVYSPDLASLVCDFVGVDGDVIFGLCSVLFDKSLTKLLPIPEKGTLAGRGGVRKGNIIERNILPR